MAQISVETQMTSIMYAVCWSHWKGSTFGTKCQSRHCYLKPVSLLLSCLSWFSSVFCIWLRYCKEILPISLPVKWNVLRGVSLSLATAAATGAKWTKKKDTWQSNDCVELFFSYRSPPTPPKEKVMNGLRVCWVQIHLFLSWSFHSASWQCQKKIK